MSALVRFALVMHVSERFDGRPPMISPQVQVWSQEKHVVTISLGDYQDLDLPETADTDTLEGYAVAAARAAARHLADWHMSAVETGTLHSRVAMEIEAAHV